MADTTDPKSFEEIVEWAYGTLPRKIRRLPDFPGIQVVDEPPADVLEEISDREKWRGGTELRFRRRWISTPRKTAMKHGRRRAGSLRPWASPSGFNELWAGLWVGLFGRLLSKSMKKLAGTTRLELATSAVTAVRL
jgi:hypothetical protein